ncbi:hypothetical protein SAMN05443247_06532 [Bradyrhizobium erythrophlei]|nr:hypothetical protein SAMN05443247_06532 [Bradyrhizobium erythrophlei]
MDSFGKFILLTCFLIQSTLCAYAQEDDPLFRIVTIDTPTGLEIGRGFDVLTGKPRADCVDRSIVEAHPDFGPNSVSFRSIRVENSAQLDKALGISAAASVNAGYFSGGASASFSNSLSVSSYSLSYVVKAVVSGKGSSIRDAKLKEQYRTLISGGNEDSMRRFRTICGDGYISEFTMGGDFQAVVQIHTHTKSETESIAASVNASFSMASGAASFSSSLKKAAQSNEVTVLSFQRGGSGPIAITPDDIATKASALPASIKQTPTPTEAAIFSYVLLLEDPKLPLIDFAEREDVLARLSELSARARDQEADAQYILDHPSEFYSSPTDLPPLAGEIQSLSDYRSVIRAKADACVRAAGNCVSAVVPIPQPTARPARR